METPGKRIDLHTHSLLSDGALLPGEIARYAAVMGFAAIAVTDHVDYSNLECVIKKLLLFTKKHSKFLDVLFIPGVEITHADPRMIKDLAKDAKKLGAKIIVVHGETPAEPVAPGTNLAAVSLKGLVDILAHPGNITEQEAQLAAQNGIFLEITAKHGHKETNKHVATAAIRTGAKLIVNTDAHKPEDYISQQAAFDLAKEAGLTDEQAKAAIWDNPVELLARKGIKII
jgi:histidinol phosphatase-like PHP family hydrolase